MKLPAILTDIEGTTSSIAFVKDVLFPYARRALPAFVAARGQDPEVRRWLDQVALENGGLCSDAMIVEVLQGWIDSDRKHTALKALQGLMWAAGYAAGDYRAHFYADAADSLRRWFERGHPIHVYSSGSVPAQQLFFGYSECGDLRPLVSGWYDTEIGGKREVASYTRIAERIGLPPADILFLSDVVEELDAARAAGLRTALLDRRADYPQPRLGSACNGHPRVESFDELALD